MEFLSDLWQFLKVRKKFWLLPIIVILLLFGVLIVLTSGSAIPVWTYVKLAKIMRIFSMAEYL